MIEVFYLPLMLLPKDTPTVREITVLDKYICIFQRPETILVLPCVNFFILLYTLACNRHRPEDAVSSSHLLYVPWSVLRRP